MNDDLEWPMLSYYVIYYEKFRKVMQQTEKEFLKFDINIPVVYLLRLLYVEHKNS